MATPPLRDEIAGTPTNAEAKAGFGKLWDYVTGLLGATGDPAAARSAMGIVELKQVTASVASNALTVTLNPTTLDFRSSTITSGTVNTRTIATAISAVVPSGATLGTANATLSKVMLLAIDNAGTVELAVCNSSLSLDESTLISTTVLDTSADSASVIYSTTARTNVPFRIVGYVESTQTTAGTWAATPSKIQGIGGQIQSATASGSSGGITRGTAVTASGTSIDFTSIPYWVKRITILWKGVSTSGTSLKLFQIGDSGGIETTGYLSSSNTLQNGSISCFSSTAGFLLSSGGASEVISGSMTITLIGSNQWICNGSFGYSAGSFNWLTVGDKTLSDTLDRVRITTVNGTDTFDAGSINILYE